MPTSGSSRRQLSYISLVSPPLTVSPENLATQPKPSNFDAGSNIMAYPTVQYGYIGADAGHNLSSEDNRTTNLDLWAPPIGPIQPLQAPHSSAPGYGGMAIVERHGYAAPSSALQRVNHANKTTPNASTVPYPCAQKLLDPQFPCLDHSQCPKLTNSGLPEACMTVPPMMAASNEQDIIIGPTSRRRSAEEDAVQPSYDTRSSAKRQCVDSKADSSDSADGKEEQPPRPKSHMIRGREPHNLVERRYREHLNGQIESLRMVLPALRDPTTNQADIEDSAMPARMPSKATVISSAITHIHDLHVQDKRMREQIELLQTQVAGLQRLVRCDDCSILQYLTSLQLGPSPSMA